MPYRFFPLALVALLGTGALFGQNKKIDFTEYDLDNGLHVILHRDNAIPIAAVTVLYHVGSKNETPGLTGLAHFFEHLLFEGSENIARGEFDRYTAQAGGVNNAYTTEDITFYYEVFPSHQLKMGLWLESERMMHAKIDSAGIETQRSVVKEEKRERIDNQPYGKIPIALKKGMYDTHPYRWPVIGSMEDLSRASMDDFMTFYRTFYVPQNATLTIAGDIDIEKTKAWIQAYFGPIPRGVNPIPRPAVVEPPQRGEKRDTVYDHIQLPAVLYAYHIPDMTHADTRALDMLSLLLAGSESSRMYRSLVDKKQQAVEVDASVEYMEDPGMFVALGVANQGVSPEELDKAISAQIEAIKKKPVSEREFQKARNRLESEFVASRASMLSIAEQLAEAHTTGDTHLINTEMERFMKITRDDIQRVAKQYLAADNRLVLYYLPYPEETASRQQTDNNR